MNCTNCKFSHLAKYKNGPSLFGSWGDQEEYFTQLECRKKPPKAAAFREERWPKLYNGDFCYEFKEKE